MKVIINADDFGYGPSENASICKAMEDRKITSTTIMAVGNAFEEAVKRIPDFSHCSFGTHLTATEFKPCLPAQIYHDAGIVNDDGTWNSKLRGCPKRFRPLIASQLEKEWGEQIKKCLDHSVPVSHLDSHHHVHTVPWLWPAVRAVQKKYQIKKIRNTKNLYSKTTRKTALLLLLKSGWTFRARNLCNIQTTDYFTDVMTFLSKKKANINKNIELMCHPGKEASKEEEELLYSPWQETLSFPVDLINYNEL